MSSLQKGLAHGRDVFGANTGKPRDPAHGYTPEEMDNLAQAVTFLKELERVSGKPRDISKKMEEPRGSKGTDQFKNTMASVREAEQEIIRAVLASLLSHPGAI